MIKRTKGATEIITYRCDFARALEEIWQGGFAYTVGDYLRPTTPNGYEYTAATTGQTGHEEPNWPQTVDETVEDGSIVWTCKAFGALGTDTIDTRSVTVDPGITLESSAIDGTGVQFKISGGTAGQVYDVKVSIDTVAGDTYDQVVRYTVTE